MHNPVVDWLNYRSYEWNRIQSPHIPYYKWRKLYQDAIQFEEIYNNYLKKSYKEKNHESIRTN